MIVIPMPWHAVPADALVIMPDGRRAHVSGQLDVYGCRLIDGAPDYPDALTLVPVLVRSEDEQLADAIAVIARYFTIGGVSRL